MPTREEMIDAGWDEKELDELLYKEGRMTDDFPEISTDELVRWLQKKYRRHGEIEDGVAAERLKSQSAEVSRLENENTQMKYLVARAIGCEWEGPVPALQSNEAPLDTERFYWGGENDCRPMCKAHRVWPCRKCGTKHYEGCQCSFCK